MSGEGNLVCWKCGHSLADQPLPFSRLAECTGCRAELHVCRLCTWFDPRVANACREPVAEEVKEKERANFCGYFAPRPGAYPAPDQSAQRAARTELDALFGDGPAASEESAEGGSLTPEDEARRKLDDLFGH